MSELLFNISADSVSQIFRKATHALGIEDLTFHDSRHEACARLARKLGVRLSENDRSS